MVCPDSGAMPLIVVTGGNGNDTIVVDPSVPAGAKVRINGNAGDDTLVGGNGDDVLEAGENYNGPDNGHDRLEGNGGSDVLYADPGGDNLLGGPGNDLLVNSVPTCQGHTYDGGTGEDTVSYARSNDNLRVALGGTGGPPGCGNPDQVLGDNESLEGSDGPDVLVGDNGDNSIMGHLGADTLIGKGGSDFIEALDGQRDKDRLRRRATTKSPRTRRTRSPAAERRLERYSANPSSPISGTKRQGPIGSASSCSPRRRSSVSMSASPASIGTTRRPPSASCASSAGGGAGAVAWTAIASNGRALGDAEAAVADDQLDVADAQRGERLRRRRARAPRGARR